MGGRQIFCVENPQGDRKGWGWLSGWVQGTLDLYGRPGRGIPLQKCVAHPFKIMKRHAPPARDVSLF
jgi:hypothetical protein